MNNINTTSTIYTKNESGARLIGLEIIRFLAAFSVLLWHYQHFSYNGGVAVNYVAENLPFYSLLHFFYEHGGIGVQIFWCISGFIFFWKYQESISSQEISGKKFFILRFSRLYPLHFITLLLVAALQLTYPYLEKDFIFKKRSDGLYLFILQLFMASNWGFEKEHFFQGNYISSFNSSIWSVSVELLVYFLFFALLRFFRTNFLINIAVIIAAFTAFKLGIQHNVLSCIIYFYIGGLSFTASNATINSRFKKDITFLTWSIVWITPLFIWYFDLKIINIFYIIYTPICLFSFAQNFPVKPFIQKLIQTAGNLTYASYLLHIPLQILISIFFSSIKTMIPMYNPIFFISYITTVFVLSYYTYHYYEIPAQNYIRMKFNILK